jgi:hypothetical protein
MGLGRSGWGSEASSTGGSAGGSAGGFLNILISFLNIPISLPHSPQGNNPCQHLDDQQQRTEAEDPHQRIQLFTVELYAATHVQRQITLDQMGLVMGRHRGPSAKRGGAAYASASPGSGMRSWKRSLIELTKIIRGRDRDRLSARGEHTGATSVLGMGSSQ